MGMVFAPENSRRGRTRRGELLLVKQAKPDTSWASRFGPPGFAGIELVSFGAEAPLEDHERHERGSKWASGLLARSGNRRTNCRTRRDFGEQGPSGAPVS